MWPRATGRRGGLLLEPLVGRDLGPQASRAEVPRTPGTGLCPPRRPASGRPLLVLSPGGWSASAGTGPASCSRCRRTRCPTACLRYVELRPSWALRRRSNCRAKALPDLPAGVIAAGDFPPSILIGPMAAVASSAGNGTVTQAACAGVGVLAVPQMGDQPLIAQPWSNLAWGSPWPPTSSPSSRSGPASASSSPVTRVAGVGSPPPLRPLPPPPDQLTWPSPS